MSTKISSTDFVRSIGDCLARVRYRGESFIVRKNDLPIALVSPLPNSTGPTHSTLADFTRAWPEPTADRAFADDLERINAADQPLVNRWGSSSTPRR